MVTQASALALAESMYVPVLVYAPLLVPDRPRAIDRVIDYFGDAPRTRPLRLADSAESAAF